MSSTPQPKDTRTMIFVVAPVSVNAMYRAVGRRVIMSARGREFKKEVGRQLDRSVDMLMGAVDVSIIFSFDDGRRRDVDNFAKAILDCLKGVMFEDDSDIVSLYMVKRLRQKTNSIEVSVTRC